MFWGVLIGSERFSKILEGYLAFIWRCDVLEVVPMRLEAFSWVLRYSEKFLNVMKRYLTRWNLLSHSEAFTWVLSCSERLLKVLSHFVTFMFFFETLQGILIGYEQFWKVSKSSEAFLTFLDILRCYEAFSWVLSGSQRFLKHQRSSLTFCCVLRRSQVYWKVAKGSSMLWGFANDLKCYETF